MADLREFWDEMKDGDKVLSDDDVVAYKKGIHLYWSINSIPVPADRVLHGDWTLVKPKPVEIEEERWMRCEDSEDKWFLYQSSDSLWWRKSEVEGMKNFLYWGGEDLPWGDEWPLNSQVLWVNRNNELWHFRYDKKNGYTEQLVAGWAVMRKGE